MFTEIDIMYLSHVRCAACSVTVLTSHHLFADLRSKQADDAKLSCKHHAWSWQWPCDVKFCLDATSLVSAAHGPCTYWQYYSLPGWHKLVTLISVDLPSTGADLALDMCLC